MRKLIVAALPLALLAACNAGVPPQTETDAIACAAALAASGIADPAALLNAAMATPACAGLASDVLNAVVAKTAHAAAAAKAARAQ